MSSAFDIAAENYDTDFTFSNIGRAQRNRVFKYLNPVLARFKSSILELNCGTGADAIQFSNMGHKVLATDASKGMIEVAKSKTHSVNCKFKTLNINQISSKVSDLKYDLIFSNFGGFNCLSSKELKTFFIKASGLLSNNGRIILVVMPKHTLWECFYFLCKGQFKNIFRRNTTKGLPVNVQGQKVNTWYYNPNDIIDLAQNYEVTTLKPIGLFIPPSYMEDSYLGKEASINKLMILERCFSFSMFSKFADHFLIELKKAT